MFTENPGLERENHPPLGHRARVLVVDDDLDLLSVVSKILEEEGYAAECASGGRSALERLRREPLPDIVVVDLMMPAMDGATFIAELKAQPALSRITIVVMSGGGGHLLNLAPVSAGYLEKPVSRDRLVGTLAACLARRGWAPGNDTFGD